MSKPNPSTNTAPTIPSYQDIAQATFGTLWPEATPQDWALVVYKLREALQAKSNGPSERVRLQYEWLAPKLSTEERKSLDVIYAAASSATPDGGK